MAGLADDPWGAAMWACGALGVVGVLWALVARVRGKPLGAARPLVGVGAFGYLAIATISAASRVSASASPPLAEAEAAPEVQVSAVDPAGASTAKPTTDGADAKESAASDDATPGAEANARADPKPVDDAKPVDDPKPTDDAKPADAARPADAAAAEPAIDPGITGPPQHTGREALRQAGLIANDDRCTDGRAVAGAMRDVAAAAATEPAARVEKAIDKLEGCRKKVLWVKAASIRRKRIDAREAWVDALKTRMKDEGTPVFVSLRGAGHDRMRLGGSAEAIGKLRGQYDATLKQELTGLGFTEVVFANMKDTERFEHEVPNDHELAARELAPLKLDAPLRLDP